MLSAVNDLTTTNFFKKKKRSGQSVTLSSKVRKPLQQVEMFCDAAHERAQRYLTLMKNFMSSSSGHSTATMMCWMKKTTNAISDTGRKESVQVVLLQTHGEDGASLLMLR